MDTVLSYYGKYDFDCFGKNDVCNALNKETLDFSDLAALLSPEALIHLEQMAQKAKNVTRQHFGNSITLFTPLYIANYCVNHCAYCGFNCKNNIKRAKLTEDEMETEMRNIAQTGLKDILILTGESRYHTGPGYIRQSIEIAQKYFTTIGLEVYPLETEEYAMLQRAGADYVSVYQETYNIQKYDEVHISGPKKDFAYRFNAQERAIAGGMRGAGFGSLLGLHDYKNDAFMTALHAHFIGRKYPHAEISFSVPRLRPFINNRETSALDVFEPQLLQVMLAYRLFMPFAGITVSTRERAAFRDHVLGLAATRMSAGVKTSVGGHENDKKGDEQFDISDERSVSQINDMLFDRGFQPVFTDYIRV